jgi:hypothetical protein
VALVVGVVAGSVPLAPTFTVMDTVASSPVEFRQRARRLDDTASRLEGSLVMTLHCRADDRVWRGALANVCRDDLDRVRRMVQALAATLRTEAMQCQRLAVQLEWVPP